MLAKAIVPLGFVGEMGVFHTTGLKLAKIRKIGSQTYGKTQHQNLSVE